MSGKTQKTKQTTKCPVKLKCAQRCLGGNTKPLDTHTETSKEIDKKRCAQRSKPKEGDDNFRKRDVCFTFYDDHHNHPKINDDTMWTFMQYGLEICPSTKNMHYQGYVHFKDKYSWSRAADILEEIWGKRPSCRIAKGSVEDNLVYTSKDNIVYTWGKVPKPGERNDIKEHTDMLIRGETTVRDIVLSDPMAYHRYGRTLEKVEECIKINRDLFRTWMTKGEFYFGNAGLGKSYIWKAPCILDYKNYHRVDNDTYKKGWWDGYTNQEYVILDEFRGEKHLAEDDLFKMVDDGPYDVSIRGKEKIPFLAKKVIITSCMHPFELYPNFKGSWKQWTRRFKTFQFTEFGKFIEIDLNKLIEPEIKLSDLDK